MNETKCELCGEPMPPGETMFKFHGYSGPCPKPPLVREVIRTYEEIRSLLVAAHGKVCTRENCVLDGGPEHAEFFGGA